MGALYMQVSIKENIPYHVQFTSKLCIRHLPTKISSNTHECYFENVQTLHIAVQVNNNENLTCEGNLEIELPK